MKIFLRKLLACVMLCALTMPLLVGCFGSGDDSSKDSIAKNWKIATSTSDLYKSHGFATDEEKIRGLHEAGFRYIDLSMYSFTQDSAYMSDCWREEALKLKAVADELGMEFVQAHSQGGNPLSQSEVEFIVQATIRSIEICEVLGIKNTVVHAGWGSGLSKNEWFAKNKEFYERLLPTAEKCGVNILCENSTAANMGSNYYINTAEDMLEFIQYVDHPNFHGCWDTGHANCEPISQYDSLVTLKDELYAIHFTDNWGSDSHMMPFFGTLDINSVIKALVDIEYDGYFTLECTGSERTNDFYHCPELDVIKEHYPDDAALFSTQKMSRQEEERLLYITTEYILKNYPTDSASAYEIDPFVIVSNPYAYTDHWNGKVKGVSSTENTVTIKAGANETAFRGFMLTKGAINALVSRGYTTMEFKVTTNAPFFDIYSTPENPEFIINKGIGLNLGVATYIPSGATVKIDLVNLNSVATFDVALKFVLCNKQGWEAYAIDTDVILSDFVFTK